DELGSLGKFVFAVECGPDGAAHQSAAGYGGKDGRGQPANGDAAAIDRLLDIAVEAERRLVAQFDMGRRHAPARRSSPALQALLAPLNPRVSGRIIALNPVRPDRFGKVKSPF